jgi:hypothetical protein
MAPIDSIETAPPQWRRYLVYATVALMPLRINVQPFFKMKDKLYVSPLDLLLPALALFMLYDLYRRKPWAQYRLPPIPGLAWALLALLSCLWIARFPGGGTMKSWLKAAIDPAFFAVAGVWVFQNFSTRLDEYRRLALVLGASFSVCLLIALQQYAGPVGLPYDGLRPDQELGGVSNIRLAGWYDFRGVFAAQVGMIVPAAVAFALLDRDIAVRVAAGALAVLALSVTMAASGFISAVAGIVAVAAAFAVCRRWITGLTVVTVLIGFLFVVLPRLPRNNAEALQRGVALFAADDTEVKPTARLRRYQAVLNLLSAPVDPHNPASAPQWIKGVGAGQYQENVNAFYHPLYPRPAGRTDAEAQFDMESHEPYTFGLFETVTVELGIGGLLAVLFLLLTWIAAAGMALARPDNGGDSAGSDRTMLALAAFGAGTGTLVLSIVNNPAIRGVGGTFAFFYALALVACYSRMKS